MEREGKIRNTCISTSSRRTAYGNGRVSNLNYRGQHAGVAEYSCISYRLSRLKRSALYLPAPEKSCRCPRICASSVSSVCPPAIPGGSNRARGDAETWRHPTRVRDADTHGDRRAVHTGQRFRCPGRVEEVLVDLFSEGKAGGGGGQGARRNRKSSTWCKDYIIID